MIKRRVFLVAALAAPSAARAETYPSKPIRVILPGPAGGIIDVAMRSISDVLAADLGQQLVIDPRPGGNGFVAGLIVAAAPPDGYTLELTVSAQLAFPFLMTVPFDVMADFTPVAMAGVATAIICVAKDLPIGNLVQLVEHARANPGKLNYLNPANGTGGHLIMEQIKIAQKVDITSVSYKGLPPAIPDLLAQRIQVGVVSTPIILQHAVSGAVRPIAVVAARRLRELPDVPTMLEQGFGDIEIRSALPMYGPKGLPSAIVSRLNDAVRKALGNADVQRRLAAAYIDPMPMNVAELTTWLTQEHERLGKLIRQLGIKADGG
ncbi:MAG: tripartite tricarboxylate transporter substrate binding protein [Enhydrobacter sp.]|nr:tripartite tricarboxylate transporter substrate binding protein [Enhydrobacter sp.]